MYNNFFTLTLSHQGNNAAVSAQSHCR